MRKLLRFKDGESYELSPITYDEFILCKQLYVECGSDIEFEHFLREHDYHELSEFHFEHETEDRELMSGIEYWVEVQDQCEGENNT